MSELWRPHTLEAVQYIIDSKQWYHIGNNDEFDWQKSTAKLAHFLHLDADLVREAYESAFTPACLSQVWENQHNQISLLEGLHNLGIQPFGWTVGDPDWQHTKLVNSGASEYIYGDRFFCSTSHKSESLPRIIGHLAGLGHRNFLVVDDKVKNLWMAKQLNYEWQGSGVTVGDYFVDLKSRDQDANALYWHIQMFNLHNFFDAIILDVDGVTIDTDVEAARQAARNIMELIKMKR
jgi:hypothetical protein